jgi:hypothetical protein
LHTHPMRGWGRETALEEIMKRVYMALAVLGVLVMATAIATATIGANAARIYIPFAFHAGDQLMPAGEYRIELPRDSNIATGSLLRIVSLDASYCQNLLSRTITGATTDTDWHVTFSKVGDQYFLSRVRNSEMGAELSKTRGEKLLAREYANAGGVATTLELKMHIRGSK